MRGRVIQSKGETLLVPVPIRAETYTAGIKWGTIGTVEEAVAKAEMSRMMKAFERFGAYLQPIRLEHVIAWEVRYPAGSKYLNGPRETSPFQAVLENYVRNRRFKGFMDGFGQGRDDLLFKMDRVLDDSIKADDAFLEEKKDEATDSLRRGNDGR